MKKYTKVRIITELLYISNELGMRILGIKLLLKLQQKNRGNRKLKEEIDKLLADLQHFNPKLYSIHSLRNDADKVHNDGFYFFNIHVHRTLVLIEFDEEEEATIIWAGSHDAYENLFKNNKLTIEKWLRSKGYIE